MNRSDPRIEALLAEADTLLLGLFDNALIGLYVIQDGRFAYVNEQLAACFGYSQDELCGGLGPHDLTAPEDWATALTAIERRIAGTSDAAHYGFRGVRKDGTTLDVEVYGVSTSFGGRPAIIGMLMEVTRRRAAERANADQLRFIERLVDTIPSPVFYKDEQGRYLGCNTAFEHYIGIPRDNLVGRTVYDISPVDLADKYFAADRALFEQRGTQTYEAAVSYADGSRHDVIFYKATFNKADGNLGGLVGVIHDISERKRMEEAVWHEANYDPLTGLPNRRLFRERLQQALRHARRHREKLALLFIDLDRFKEINDTLGHAVGDLLLLEAGKRICAEVGAVDAVARQGGDEFMVILPALTDRTAAAAAAEAIIARLAEPYYLRGHQIYVSASVGIALYPGDSELLDTLLSYADQAMYAAKAQGRNGHSFFLPAMQTAASDRHRLSNDLRHALAAGQLAVHYQPIAELASGTIVKAEALLRWRHPQRGMVSPAEFIPLAEEIGIIGEIGDWVFEEALRLARRWRQTGGDGGIGHHSLQINVNISPRQVIAGDCRDWQARIAAAGLPTSALAVEITEGLLLDDRPAVVDTLLAFDRAGIQVSIDDFGTGYSALSYLKKFDIDYIKIDQSFIRDLTTDPSDLAIAEAMIVMAHKLGIKVVAEGVETVEQRELLRCAGCDYIQGWLIARPMPADDFCACVAGRDKS